MAAGLAVGVVTSFLQTVLPDGVAPLANSGAPWFLAGLVIVYALRAIGWPAAALGVLILAAEVTAYYGISAARGFGISTATITFWLLAAFIFGAAAGVAGSWLRHPAVHRRLIATALPAGILIGEGAHLCLDTARPALMPYGVGSAVIGVALAVYVTLRLSPTTLHRVLGLTSAAAVATLIYAAFNLT